MDLYNFFIFLRVSDYPSASYYIIYFLNLTDKVKRKYAYKTKSIKILIK